MSQVLELLTLQGIDDELAAFRAALADVERRLLGDAELDDARRALQAAEHAAELARREQARLEEEVERLSDRIAREDGRLYDGSIKNPKELAGLQHEVESLRALRGRAEDRLLEALNAAESAGGRRAAAARTVDRLEALRERETAGLRLEARRLQDAIKRAGARRAAQQAKVPPRSVFLYDELRRRKGGMAVARISAGSCSGCRVTLPDAHRRRAMGGDVLVHCPNCERILVMG